MSDFLTRLLRPNIARLQPYSSARSEFKGQASIFLDANENPFNNGVNRYPDPLQWSLKQQIAQWKDVLPEQIFLGNGSDEAIDLLVRMFCNPGQDRIITLPPTYGMYEVSADIAGVEVQRIPLSRDFQPNVDAILSATDERAKLLFLCSPNNPTGNAFDIDKITTLIRHFSGIVVVDEAYSDFSWQESILSRINLYENLVVLQTFSKAWGMAGIRLGMAFAQAPMIEWFNKVKPPYNINVLTQRAAMDALKQPEIIEDQLRTLLGERDHLIHALSQMPIIEHIYPTAANFVLVRVGNPDRLYRYLVQNGIIVRNRSTVILCEGCLRITIGTPDENSQLVQSLQQYAAL